MEEFLKKLPQYAAEKAGENKKFFTKLSKKPPKQLDYITQRIHEEVFEEIDCLSCANCCKTTGPLLIPKDIERIAKHLRLKPSIFQEKYLRMDEDNDWIFNSMPCPFLGSDNYCNIYDVRPKACAEYPHTDRKKFHKISRLTLKNVEMCPAAYKAVEKLKKEITYS